MAQSSNILFAMQPLTPAFVHGWKELPAELKLRAIEEMTTISSTNAIEYVPRQENFVSDLMWYRHPVRTSLLPCYAMSSEFGNLGKKNLYRNNTFSIFAGDTTLLPPLTTRHLIRHLNASVNASHLARVLEQLQTTRYGMTNLRELHITVGCRDFGVRSQLAEFRVLFKRKFHFELDFGDVKAKMPDWKESFDKIWEHLNFLRQKLGIVEPFPKVLHSDLFDEMEALLKENITFGRAGKLAH